MPEGSVGSRGAQKSALAGVLYDKRTEAELGQLLEQLQGAAGLEPVQAAVVREAHRCVCTSDCVVCVGGWVGRGLCKCAAQGGVWEGQGRRQAVRLLGLKPVQAAVVCEAHRLVVCILLLMCVFRGASAGGKVREYQAGMDAVQVTSSAKSTQTDVVHRQPQKQSVSSAANMGGRTAGWHSLS
jgi:hypothetical protein